MRLPYRYSAFGNEEIKGEVLTPWRYAGKRIDPESGLFYFGKRYYDPKTLCWITPDPLEDIDGPNYYAYVKNNPLYYTDPNGRAIFLAFAIPLDWAAFEVTVEHLSSLSLEGFTLG